MDTVPTVLLVFVAAFAWIGLTVFVILRLRRRRNGSTLVASAPAEQHSRSHMPWRHVRPVTGQAPVRRRPGMRKVRG
jgi:hypothetical protein